MKHHLILTSLAHNKSYMLHTKTSEMHRNGGSTRAELNYVYLFKGVQGHCQVKVYSELGLMLKV